MKIRLNSALLLFSALTFIILLGVSASQYHTQLRLLQQAQHTQIKRIAQDCAFLYSQLKNQSPTVLNAYLAQQVSNGDVQWLVISEDGATIANASEESWLQRPLTQLPSIRPDSTRMDDTAALNQSQTWLTQHKLNATGSQRLLLYADFSQSTAKAKADLLQTLSWQWAAILALALVIYRLGHRWLTQPLQQIAQQLQLVDKGLTPTPLHNNPLREIQNINEALSLLTQQIKRQMDELRSKTIRLESTLQAIPDLLFEMSASGEYLQVHAQNPHLLAQQRSLLGKNVHQVLPEAAANITQQAIHQALTYGQSTNHIIELDLPDGHFVFELSSSRLPHRDGRISCLILSRDVSEREKARREIVQQNQVHEFILRTSMDGFWLLDHDGHITKTNDAYLIRSGYSRSEVIGQHISHFDCQQVENDIDHNLALLRDKGALSFETTHRARDGQSWPIEVSAGYLNHEGGLYFAFMRDISQRKRQEEQLRLWKRIFAQTSEGIVVTDTLEHILLVNTAFTQITGYGENELIGQRPNILASGRHTEDFYLQMKQSIQAQGFWQGEIWNRRKDGEIYPEWLIINAISNDAGETTHYVGLLRDISEQKANEEQIRWLANYDSLTKLPNRNLLRERANHALIHAQRQSEPLALLYLDLDHFKHINDTLGHATGDELLVQLAHHLKQSLREQDTIARQGGDEFVLLLPNVDERGAIIVAQKILDSVTRPIQIGQHELIVTPSIGIALFPRDGQDFGTLSSHADAAMYKAKSDGRHCFQLYTPAMQIYSERRLKLEVALRAALEQGEMHLAYQPQISLADNSVCGVEALVRWRNAEFGQVSPSEFIPLAEDSGLILTIGEWVTREACRQLKQWQAQGLPPLCMAVNVSALQFKQDALPQAISRILQETGVNANCLELELTESVTMDDPAGMIAKMRQLHRAGVKLAIDDFGTGYSSLSYLKSLPIDKLKIDQSFVRDLLIDPDDAAIIQTIISMAKALGYNTIAEGVESAAQREMLQELGCTQIQGYLIGKPMLGEEFIAWFAHYSDQNQSTERFPLSAEAPFAKGT